MDETILVERDGPIATVVLNRPDKLNALTRAMWAELGDTVSALSRDTAVRCIVLRGAGDKAFSPGNDISEFATQRSNKQQAIEYGKAMHASDPTTRPSALKTSRSAKPRRIASLQDASRALPSAAAGRHLTVNKN